MSHHQRLLFVAVLALVARPIAAKSSSPEQHHPTTTTRLAVTKKQFAIQDTDGLQNACQSEFRDTESNLKARVLNIDADLPSLSWRDVEPQFESTTTTTTATRHEEEHGLERFQIYWALASPEYLEKMSGSAGVVLEYLHGDDALPVLLGDAEVPSRMKVSVLCQLDVSDGREEEEEAITTHEEETRAHPADGAIDVENSSESASTKPLAHGSIRHGGLLVKDDSTNTTAISNEEAKQACGRVHKENSDKFQACMDGLVALTEDRQLLDGDESVESTAGAFADVYHALFQTSEQ